MIPYTSEKLALEIRKGTTAIAYFQLWLKECVRHIT